MFKKFLFCLLLLGIVPRMVFASDGALVKVGGKYYDTLEEAILNAGSDDTIMLISDVMLDKGIEINKTVNINLNGNDIVAPDSVIMVKGGALILSGKGTIRESKPNYGAIMVIGSDKVDDINYSVVKVGNDVTLEGWSGIFITHDNGKSYGVNVNFSGKIKSVDDGNGDGGIGIYVNGKIKDQANHPVVNIQDGAYITSTGDGLYMAGYATFNIGDAYIEGDHAGIGIKSGNLNIDGADVICNGVDNTPTSGYNNGMNASGTAIQIESNNNYAGDMNIDIRSGNIKSKNSNVIYEYIGKGNNSLVNDFNISGGKFISEAEKDVFRFSDDFLNNNSKFVAGGSYSSDPSLYLKSGYKALADNNIYRVVKNTLMEVSGSGIISTDSNGIMGWLLVGGIIVLVGWLFYRNRDKLLNLFKR